MMKNDSTDYSTLPREAMKTLRIAVDVDGTLRCNGGRKDHSCDGNTCEEPNMRIVRLFNILADFKNTEMYVWSGGGAQYARRFADKYELKVAHSRCISKFGAPKMDLCIDDIQETNLATFNLIVREK